MGEGLVTRTLLQDRIQLNLHIVVLGRLPLHGLLIPRPSPLCRNTRHGTLLGAIQFHPSSHRFVFTLDGLVVLGALLIRQFFRRFLGCLESGAYALGVALPCRLGVLVGLQGFLRFGVEGGGGGLRAGAGCVDYDGEGDEGEEGEGARAALGGHGGRGGGGGEGWRGRVDGCVGCSVAFVLWFGAALGGESLIRRRGGCKVVRQDGCAARLSGEQLQDADAVCPPRMRCVACGKERVSVANWGSVGV